LSTSISNSESTTCVKLHHVTVCTLWFFYDSSVYTHVIVMYTFGKTITFSVFCKNFGPQILRWPLLKKARNSYNQLDKVSLKQSLH